MAIIILLLLILALLLFDLAALHWGTDITDDVDSSEWERRRMWRHSPHP